MNQILLTNDQINRKKNNNKYNGNNSPDIKKIMMFFGVALIVIAILTISVYAFKVYKSKNKKEKQIEAPEITLEQVDNQVTIIVKAEAGISKIVYKWNEDEAQEEEKNGVTSYEEALEIPEGTNTLNVKVIDLNGEETEINQEFYLPEDPDKAKIEIDETIGNGKVKITASDENNKMKSIIYRWNDEEEKVIKATTDEQTIIETTIDVKRGKNTLTVVAINGKDKEQTTEKILNGVNKPTIEVVKDGNKLIMNIKHDMGLEKVEFNVNGQEFVYDENYSGYKAEQKELSYSFDLKEGENTVIIHAISNEKTDGPDGTKGTEETYRGKCEYKA